MMIRSQSFGQLEFSHQYKTDTVHNTPFFIWAFFVQPPSGFLKIISQ